MVVRGLTQFVVIVNLTLAVAFSAAVGSRQAGRGSERPLGVLEGTVVDSVIGQPIAGARVTIAAGNSAPPEDQARGAQSAPRGGPAGPARGMTVTTTLGGANPGERVVITERTGPNGERQVTAEQVLANGQRQAVDPAAAPVPPPRLIRTVMTDESGRFSFLELPTGNYTLATSAKGYLYQVYGGTSARGAAPITLVAGANAPLAVRLTPGASVTGSVVNEEREPVSSVLVYLLKAEFTVSGERRLRVVTQTFTDASGQFGLTDFAAGRYYIAAGGRPVSQGRSPYAWKYYPGVPQPDAASYFDLKAAANVPLGALVVNRQLSLKIRGRVLDSTTGRPPASAIISAVSRSPFDRLGQSPDEIRSGAYEPTSGEFVVDGVPPGMYRLDVTLRQAPSGQQTLLNPLALLSPTQDGYAIVEVSKEDVTGVSVTVPSPGKVTGKVVLASGRPLTELLPVTPAARLQVNPSRLQVSLVATMPLQPSGARSSVAVQDGTFELSRGIGGRYRLDMIPLPDNTYISEVRLNGVRVTGLLDISKDAVSELVITLNPNGGEIQGAAVDTMNRPQPGRHGLLLPDPLTETIGFFSPIVTDAEGKFRIRGLAPGRYRLYVWDSVGPDEYFDRDLLVKSQQAGTPIEIAQGARLAPSVRVILVR